MRKRRNFSEKRQAILDTLHKTTEHPSAEQIYYALKFYYPKLSLGTVYRNLQRFKQEGLASSLTVVNGQERFDGNVSEHAHFICDECGYVIDLDIPLPDDIGASVKQDGYQLTTRQLFLRGSCPRCFSKQNVE
jgi:Fur family peroxide stress response transcriptional regulator